MTRKALIFYLSFVVFCGAFVATLATIQQRNYDLRGYADATRTTELPFRAPRLGVNAELTQYSRQELERQFQLMSAAHITGYFNLLDGAKSNSNKVNLPGLSGMRLSMS